MSIAGVQRIESCLYYPSYSTLSKLSHLAGVPLETLDERFGRIGDILEEIDARRAYKSIDMDDFYLAIASSWRSFSMWSGHYNCERKLCKARGLSRRYSAGIQHVLAMVDYIDWLRDHEGQTLGKTLCCHGNAVPESERGGSAVHPDFLDPDNVIRRAVTTPEKQIVASVFDVYADPDDFHIRRVADRVWSMETENYDITCTVVDKLLRVVAVFKGTGRVSIDRFVRLYPMSCG